MSDSWRRTTAFTCRAGCKERNVAKSVMPARSSATLRSAATTFRRRRHPLFSRPYIHLARRLPLSFGFRFGLCAALRTWTRKRIERSGATVDGLVGVGDTGSRDHSFLKHAHPGADYRIGIWRTWWELPHVQADHVVIGQCVNLHVRRLEIIRHGVGLNRFLLSRPKPNRAALAFRH